jgi:hypothetical protein
MHLTPNSYVVSLLKMLTYYTYAALLRQLTPFEHLNVEYQGVKSRQLAGALGRDLLFLRSVLVIPFQVLVRFIF